MPNRDKLSARRSGYGNGRGSGTGALNSWPALAAYQPGTSATTSAGTQPTNVTCAAMIDGLSVCLFPIEGAPAKIWTRVVCLSCESHLSACVEQTSLAGRGQVRLGMAQQDWECQNRPQIRANGAGAPCQPPTARPASPQGCSVDLELPPAASISGSWALAGPIGRPKVAAGIQQSSALYQISRLYLAALKPTAFWSLSLSLSLAEHSTFNFQRSRGTFSFFV